MSKNKTQKRETLDPKDWKAFKTLGRDVMEDSLSHLENIRDYTNTKRPAEKQAKLLVPLSEKGEGEEAVIKTLKENYLPYEITITPPRFWGYVAGTGSPFGVLVNTLIASRNAGAASFYDVPLYKQATSWIKEMLEVPADYSGVFVSGGSEANFTALAVARNAKAEANIKTKGMQGQPKKMVLYGSEEIHHCLERSVELLGLGNEAIRWIPVDANYTIKVDALKKKVKADRKEGLLPFCVIGNAGTVNTGAFDDLNALADFCQKENLWFHVDGAFGAWVKLSESHKYLTNGLGRADSLAVDLHKWMNMQYPIGLTLVKDKVAHYSTFVYGHDAKYLETAFKDKDLDTLCFTSSLPLSMPNTGLKAYILLRAFGKAKYRRLVQQNIDDITYLASKLKEEPLIEIAAPVISNIVCFRYNPGGLDDKQLEVLNRRILASLWEETWGMISDTTLKGKYVLRACSVNHRSTREDFDYLVSEIKRLGVSLT